MDYEVGKTNKDDTSCGYKIQSVKSKNTEVDKNQYSSFYNGFDFIRNSSTKFEEEAKLTPGKY